MNRRTLLTRGWFSALAGMMPRALATPQSTHGSPSGAAPIMQSFSSEDHRRRLRNIQACERGIRDCMKKYLITNYIPGQVSYNLGEYPSRKPYNPGEYDENELDRLRDGGIRLIQIMEDWT